MTDRASSNPTVQPTPSAVLPRISAPATPLDVGEGTSEVVAASPVSTRGSSAPTGWSPSAWRLGRR
jgi:hypothetical protein